MNYDKELYLDTGIYGIDEDVENHKEKIVKCRKSHKCVSCDRTIKKEEMALYESGFLDGYPVHAYTCIKCLEEWMEESGQV